MHIHIYSRSFAPTIGGLEQKCQVLAHEFIRQGHIVTVVTESQGQADLPFQVVRRPGFAQYFALARRADAILSSPLSLRRLPTQLLSGRRLVVSHPILYPGTGFAAGLKRLAARLVTGVVPSRFMAGHFPGAVVIHNPYDAETFTWPVGDKARSGIVFAGRLVPEKGCDLLLRAIAESPASIGLTIVGEGPERTALSRLAQQLGIADRVEFRGPLIGKALAAEMQAHRVMVVPTLCEEAFGIVALEGLACGCRMVVAESGGLPEAVGDLALTFPRGDGAALAALLETALGGDDVPPARATVEAHLARFTPSAVADRYLELICTKA